MKHKTKKIFMILSSSIIGLIVILITINEVNATKITEEETFKKFDSIYDLDEKKATSRYLKLKSEIPKSKAKNTDKKHKQWAENEENQFEEELENYSKRTNANFNLKSEIEQIDNHLYLIKLVSNYDIDDAKEQSNQIVYTVDTKKDTHLSFKDILKDDYKQKKLLKALSIENQDELKNLLNAVWTLNDKEIVLIEQNKNKTLTSIELKKLYPFINNTYYDDLITGEVAKEVEEIKAEIKKEKERKKKLEEEKKRKAAEKEKQEQAAKETKENNQGYISITFDDGPDPDVTPQILDILDEYNVKATFFALSRYVKAYPQLAKEIINRGHELANHSMNHMDLSKQTQKTLNNEVIQSKNDIESITGQEVTLFRPPYGSTNQLVKNTLTESNQKSVMWSIDTEDWKNQNANTINQIVQAYAKPGSIILMHDIHQTTAQALPLVLENFKQQGLQQVTISELRPYIEDTYNDGYYGR